MVVLVVVVLLCLFVLVKRLTEQLMTDWLEEIAFLLKLSRRRLRRQSPTSSPTFAPTYSPTPCGS